MYTHAMKESRSLSQKIYNNISSLRDIRYNAPCSSVNVDILDILENVFAAPSEPCNYKPMQLHDMKCHSNKHLTS